MNAEDSIKLTGCESTCVTCLKTTNILYPMSLELKTEYITFVAMVKEESVMMICNICRCQLRRCLRFKQQCQTARNLLNDDAQELILYPQNLSLCFNLEISKTEIYSLTNELATKKNHSRSKVKNQNGSLRNRKRNNFIDNQSETLDTVNSPMNHENASLKTELVNVPSIHLENGSPVKGVLENGSPVKGVLENDSLMNDLKLDGLDDDFDSLEFNNDDDVPLLMLKECKSEKRKRKKVVCTEILDQVDQVVLKKAKKELKEGFSSRMVQETDEYVVIKLTKEQVLQEMDERSKTEMYQQSPFKCEKCIKGFNFQDVLNKHMEKHTKEIGSFQCDMCYQYCRSQVSLRGHIKSHTTRYRCKICGEVRLSRQHLLEHHAAHTRQHSLYACNACTYTTSKRTVMQRHVRSHTRTESHACERCGKLFKSVESLRVHTARHDKSSRLQCIHCSLSFVYRSLLRRHIARAHESNEYYCVECDTRFKSSESLRLHFKKAKKHRDSSSYKHLCPECPSRFFTAGALSAHMSNAHGVPRGLACTHCNRRYSGKDALRAHIWRTHCERT